MRRELRFGVRVGDRVSQYWKVRADATRPDIYVASQRTGHIIHISIHDPSYGIHVSHRSPKGTDRKLFEHPRPLVAGVIRMVQLRVPVGAVTYDEDPKRAVQWVESVGDSEIWIAFEILVEEPGAAAREDEWNHGTMLVGRISRADGGTIVVAAWPMRAESGRLTFPASAEERDLVRAVAAEGKLRALVHGANSDGSIWFLELRGELATPDGEATSGATIEP